MKRQDKAPEKQLNEVEIDNLPEKEFRIMMVKKIQDLKNRIEKMHETFTKDLEELFQFAEELKNRDEQYTRRNQEQNN